MASALLGMDPPELPVAQLVRLTGLFGISENRARVALSRMVAGGEATSDGAGHYRLAGHLADRQSRQSASRAGTDRVRRLVVARRRDDDRQHGRGPGRPPAHARLRAPGRVTRGRVDAAGQRRVRLPGSLDADIELMTAGRRTGSAGAAALGPPTWSGTGRRFVRRPRVLGPRRPRGAGPGLRAVGRRAAAPPGRSAAAAGTCRRAGRAHASALPTTWDVRYRATLNDWSRAGRPTGGPGRQQAFLFEKATVSIAVSLPSAMDIEVAFSGVPVTELAAAQDFFERPPRSPRRTSWSTRTR